MLRATPMIVVVACLGPTAAVRATPLSFKDAQLGMTRAEWRSLAPPEGAGPDAVPACSDEPRIVALAHNPLSATLQPSDVVACGYVDLFGHTALLHSIRLDPTCRANDLQYDFVRGRLAEIRFKASIDAFSDVTAMLEQQYGPPSETTRDMEHTPSRPFARVILKWSSPGGEIVVADPSVDPTQLQVSLSTPDEARPASASIRADAGRVP